MTARVPAVTVVPRGPLLKTDSKASFVDGMLSLGIAVGVLFLRNTDPSGSAGFVPFLADSIITLVLAAMLISKPVEIIRESSIELALGKLQDEDQYNECDLVVRRTGALRYLSMPCRRGNRGFSTDCGPTCPI
ncbi:MAG: cation transporter [Spirochaetia bacterium]